MLLSLEDGVEKIVAARHSILAALPLPSDIPEEELQPIILPHSYSLGDFFRNTTVKTLRIFNHLFLVGLSIRNHQTEELPHLGACHDVLVS
ncbi:hypothetical protein EDD15DRAFT_2263079 [Pisolithus albus]|nr:hypothetical protein EDD15DRAFT_2263079 [Pisolithus albus]